MFLGVSLQGGVLLSSAVDDDLFSLHGVRILAHGKQCANLFSSQFIFFHCAAFWMCNDDMRKMRYQIMKHTIGPIEKNIPPPTENPGPKKTAPYWHMEIGDSVLIKGQSQTTITGHAGKIGKITGAKFMTRTMDGGIRVWRIA